MAKVFVVAVRDRAIDAFSRPWFVPSVGMAIRTFSDEINRAAADNPLHAHPEDYDLYHLGVFADDTGIFHQDMGVPKQIAVGKDVVVGRS